MAQFFQIWSRGDKPSMEELQQFYPNTIVENQATAVQYVMNADEAQQQFQGQQILMSSEQLVVIENQGRQLLVDPSQYVLQTAPIEGQPGQTQMYFIEELERAEAQVTTTTSPTAVVVNPQNQQSPVQPVSSPPGAEIDTSTSPIANRLSTPVNAQTTLVATRNILHVPQLVPQVQLQARIPNQHLPNTTPVQLVNQPGQMQQSVQQIKIAQRNSSIATPGIQRNASVSMPVIRTPQKAPEVPALHYTIESGTADGSNNVESTTQDAVCLSDGRIILVSEYKKLQQERERIQKRLGGTPEVTLKLKCPLPVARNKAVIRMPSAEGTNSIPTQVQQRLPTPNPQLNLAQQRNEARPPPPNQPLMQQAPAQSSPLQQVPMSPVKQAPSAVQQTPVQQPPVQQPQRAIPSQYIIQPPSRKPAQQYGPIPPYLLSEQIQQIIESTSVSEEFSDSIRMLVVLENGEQRLITFTLPKDMCTIHEILEQVGVPFENDTKIDCWPTDHMGINYIVMVGQVNCQLAAEVPAPAPVPEIKKQPSPPPLRAATPPKSVSPDPMYEPRYIPGQLALCNHCGYIAEDFNRCMRCKRKLPNDCKVIACSKNIGLNGKKFELVKAVQKLQDKKNVTLKTLSPSFSAIKANYTVRENAKKRLPVRGRLLEPEPVVLLSSDDEDHDAAETEPQSETQAILKKLNNPSISLCIKKEPSFQEIRKLSTMEFSTDGNDSFGPESEPSISVSIPCRTIRIGSYKYISNDHVIVNTTGITLKVPHPNDQSHVETITIDRKHIIKILVNFQKSLTVMFVYVPPALAAHVRNLLGMVQGGEYYFDPVGTEESHRRITFLPELMTEAMKVVLKDIFEQPTKIMEELSVKEANDILIKTCPKDVTGIMAANQSFTVGYGEVVRLLIYPPGSGGLPINTEDYCCLAQDQFLNDVIIDFYLKYLHLNLPEEMQKKVHIFSTFFYKRLTTKPANASRRSHPTEMDSNLTAAQKRHARVEKWTKSVNLFEKDFIIIPINENCHWFLAIICFPSMEGSTTFDGKPVSLPPSKTKTETTKKSRLEKAILCEDEDEVSSDRDEAEGDENDIDSDSDDQEEEVEEPQPVTIKSKSKRIPIKQPCILIFDSLPGASRNRVVATLRGYLTCEYKMKMGKEKLFSNDVIRGARPKVPQQNNFTDCGLYLLQYVEHFFNEPITDYHIPMKQLANWFDEYLVTKKREDIALLIQDLMTKYNKDPAILPKISLPTLNGNIIKHDDEEEEYSKEFDDEEDEEEEDDDSDVTTGILKAGEAAKVGDDLERSDQCMNESDEIIPPTICSNDGFEEQIVTNLSALKPDVSEISQRASNRDTMAYLKSKRLSKYKGIDTVEAKKFKSA